MSRKPGICSREGCTEPRHKSKTGKFSPYCRAHQNEQGRLRHRAAGKLPTAPNPYVRVIARRCEKCGVKYPSVRLYFDLSRDTDKRLNMTCSFCDGTSTSHISLPQPGTALYRWEAAP